MTKKKSVGKKPSTKRPTAAKALVVPPVTLEFGLPDGSQVVLKKVAKSLVPGLEAVGKALDEQTVKAKQLQHDKNVIESDLIYQTKMTNRAKKEAVLLKKRIDFLDKVVNQLEGQRNAALNMAAESEANFEGLEEVHQESTTSGQNLEAGERVVPPTQAQIEQLFRGKGPGSPTLIEVKVPKGAKGLAEVGQVIAQAFEKFAGAVPAELQQ